MKEGAKNHYERGLKYYDTGDFRRSSKEFNAAAYLLERDKKVNEKLNLAAPEARSEVASVRTNQETMANRGKKVSRPEYVIGAEDVLSIFVWQNQDLSQDVTVRPDGRISFPLIDDIEVESLTIPQLDKLITEKLRTYIKYPEVSISIRRLGGKRVIVLGEVNYPGVYQVTGTESVLEAIAMAQGFKNTSLASSVVVVKGMFTGNPRLIRSSSNMALRGIGSQNIILESGDVVFVPKKPISDINWLVNEISGPIAQFCGDVTLIKALTHIRTKVQN
jgi:polysaccharide export outer membrane protein